METVFNFADSYRVAGLSPPPEVIKLRQEPFEKIVGAVSQQMAIDLTRLYFGLPLPDRAEWFRAAFADTDPSFSMIENERESAVLAACILSAESKKNEFAALAVLCASVEGKREPVAVPGVVDDIHSAFMKKAIQNRVDKVADVQQIKLPSKPKWRSTVEAIKEAPDLPKSIELGEQVGTEAYETTKAMASQIQGVMLPLADSVRELREEVSILWWLFGAKSRILEKAFADFPVGVASVLVGIDLADLSSSVAGPASAAVLIDRAIWQNRKGKIAATNIKSVANEIGLKYFDKLAIDENLKRVADICPALTSLWKVNEIGESPAWEKPFEKSTLLDSELKFEALELGMQIYRERLLLRELERAADG